MSKISGIIFLVAIIVAGFFLPDIVMKHIDKKNKKLTAREFMEVSFTVQEELPLCEKIIIANSTNKIRLKTDNTKLTKVKAISVAKSYIEKSFTGCYISYYDVSQDGYKVIATPKVYMQSDNRSIVVWEIHIEYNDALTFGLIIDDATNSLLSFNYINSNEKFSELSGTYIGMYFIEEMNRQAKEEYKYDWAEYYETGVGVMNVYIYRDLINSFGTDTLTTLQVYLDYSECSIENIYDWQLEDEHFKEKDENDSVEVEDGFEYFNEKDTSDPSEGYE